MELYYLFLIVLAFFNQSQAIVFTSTPNAAMNVCKGETVTFNWTYTSGTPNTITWTKRNNDQSLNASVATLSLGSFFLSSPYNSRVSQVGNAGISLSDVTPADDGIYQVEITDAPSILKGTTTLTTYDTPNGTIRASRNASVVRCDGLASLGSGSLSLVLDRTSVKSVNSLSLEYSPRTGGKFCCCVIMRGDSSKCLPAGESQTNCSAQCVDIEGPDSVRDPDPLPIIAVIILIILLVLKLITDVLFVGYRWESKIGVKYTQICKRIISTVKKEYILYWSCFIQGIIGVICGVAFFIVMCIEYTERLEEGLHVAVLLICIIISSIGVINIVMCLCCSQSHKSSDHDDKAGTTPKGPSSWLCCCCPVTISPEKESAKRPSPPIPAAMASPRRPVPPNSTSARPLPSPTSDPTSDSAFNPRIHLDPLDVEEPTKKKKKKRKNKKKGIEAGGESSDPPVNTGDSDD